MPAPLYTPSNCSNPAYQLDWSYSLFWDEAPASYDWLDELKRRTEPDHIRILQHHSQEPNVSQFLISTKPAVAPLLIAQRVKGRLQHLLGHSPFRRNYALRIIGSTRRDKLLEYLAGQLDHHPLADWRVDVRLRDFQVHSPEVDLAQPEATTHARYWYNLHIVLVREGRLMETQCNDLSSIRDMILAAIAGSYSPGPRSPGTWLLPGAIARRGGAGIYEQPGIRARDETQGSAHFG